ncbi:MAG: hypothetical protein ACYC9W_02475 [Candidatus Limnocylindria bacterium]
MIGLFLIAILVASCDVVPPAIADVVTLRPDQMILPPEQFPLPGYRVDTDERVGTNSWTRRWSGSDAFSWVRVYVTVLGPSARSYNAIAATTCDQWTYTPPALSSAEIAAPVVGDGAKACAYDFQSLPAGSLVYTTGTRNVLVSVGVWRRSASPAAAAAFVASLADYQLWVIDKVAPLAGVALRPTPTVQVPGVAAPVAPQSTPRAAAAATPLSIPRAQASGGPNGAGTAANAGPPLCSPTSGTPCVGPNGVGNAGNEPSVVQQPIGNVPMGYWWPKSAGGGGVAPGGFCGKEFISITDYAGPSGRKAIYVDGVLIGYDHIYMSPVNPGSYTVVTRNPDGTLRASFIAQVPKCLGYTYIND